jgi:hypothetical protein
VIYYGDLVLEICKWGILLCIGLWVVGLVRTWWGDVRLAYFAPMPGIVLGAVPATAIFFPSDAFEYGRGEWLMGMPILFGAVVLLTLGMLFVSAVAHGVFLLRKRKQKNMEASY